jgi:hypothetical protein
MLRERGYTTAEAVAAYACIGPHICMIIQMWIDEAAA